ncbi:hypothetical protein FRUB_07457 [Fimbriiglobus ruber]|uniref:Uncharacterized protein n=2 Tax=Fimbriiglobus ruber TaxID=1908690 RepID=A0A225DQ55_9BACT|nr:hypothetical protein FRUB_07457 [Fimbriiglobus ruber]
MFVRGRAMKPVWLLDGDDVIRFQSDSAGFVRFVNNLLAAQARAVSLQDRHLHLNQKDTEADGGVDAVIDCAVPGDPTGRLGVPTCWQFKASPTTNIKARVPKGEEGGQEVALRQEVNKPYVRRLIEGGHGYRFCIADDLAAEKKGAWEGWLLNAVRAIHPTAPAPQVLTASDLAHWANRYLLLVREYSTVALSAVSSLSEWQREFTAITPTFVPVGRWDQTAQMIRDHVGTQHPVTTILTVQGEAGVGKSRFVCEALLVNEGLHALVAVTSDEKVALEFAQHVSRNPQTRAILVADECSLEYRDRLERLLPACGNRLCVVAIDNSLKRQGASGEMRLEHLQPGDIETILERNFLTLPADRRRSYASLAQGFVRLAVDLCRRDWQVPADGRIDSLFGFFHDHYLRKRLQPEELQAVELVSLLPRIGYRDEVGHELERVCAHPQIALRPIDVVQVATKLKQSPGFIAFAGRYLYVTPRLIAKVAFEAAWNRWVGPDPDRFLGHLAPEFLDRFIERVQVDGTEPMRAIVSDFFFAWASKLGPPDLGREDSILRLVRLVEVRPNDFLPVLRGLLERTPIDELRGRHSASEEGAQARRQLVWLAEKVACFPEFFSDAERILLQLTRAETEADLGNSASRVWASLFRIVLSGSSIPFPERLSLLERRLENADSVLLTLALGLLDEIFVDGPVWRLAAPPWFLGDFRRNSGFQRTRSICTNVAKQCSRWRRASRRPAAPLLTASKCLLSSDSFRFYGRDFWQKFVQSSTPPRFRTPCSRASRQGSRSSWKSFVSRIGVLITNIIPAPYLPRRKSSCEIGIGPLFRTGFTAG